MRFKPTRENDTSPVKTWNVRWPEKRSRGQDAASFLPTTVTSTAAKPQLRKISKPPKTRFCKTHSQTKLEDQPHATRFRRFPCRYVRISSSRGLSAAILSIFICVALLFYMISLFATKLHTFESELASRNVLDDSLSANTLFQSPYVFSSSRESPARRKLASVQPLHLKTPQRENNIVLLSQKLRGAIRSLGLLQSFLRNPNRKYMTTNAFNTLSGYQNPLQNLSELVGKTDEVGDSSATFITIYHVRNERRKLATASAPPVYVHNVQRQLVPQPISYSVPAHSLPQHNRPTPPKPRHGTANLLYRNALNVVGDLVPFAPSVPNSITTAKRTAPISPGPRMLPEKKASNRIAYEQRPGLIRRQGKRANSERRRAKSSSPSGIIEMWMLDSGSSICRIYDVARLSGGKLILPKWMEKHESTLQQQCGLKDVIFAIKTAGKDNQVVIEKSELNATGTVRVLDKMNMDLIGTIAPRHHMPHFVTDILFPLKASEILQGSGTSIKKLESIRLDTAANHPETTKEAFPDIRPSLFLRPETWDAKTSEWVQRFANFFSHPAVGYALLSEKEGANKISNGGKKSTPIWRFRSVLSTNMNQYESEGLFNPSGENIVLSRNGLLGTPSWNMEGISQTPCRVVVTALTRQGPRALLHLDALRKTALDYFKNGGLALDFQVVEFENTEFDKQVKIMQRTNVLIATHGAGNANIIFMRREATVIEVFPFAYRAGPFNSLAETFGLEYKPVMSAPQTSVFKECMNRNESKEEIKLKVFRWWDEAVAMEAASPWVHRLELEKEFGEPGKSEGMATRRCVRTQQLAFNTEAVAAMALQSAKQQCSHKQVKSNQMHVSGRWLPKRGLV